jgi:hypothetical protein
MNSIMLPFGHQRAVLRSFWMCISFAFGTGLTLACWLLGVPFSIAIGLAGVAAFGMIPVFHEELVRRLYRAWNGRLVRPIARFAARCILGICYFIIFVATGRAGSGLRCKTHDGSGWCVRTSLTAAQYRSPFVGDSPQNEKHWMRAYVRWALKTGNVWSICLLPFLWLIRLLSQEEDKVSQANIYTLF